MKKIKPLATFKKFGKKGLLFFTFLAYRGLNHLCTLQDTLQDNNIIVHIKALCSTLKLELILCDISQKFWHPKGETER